MVGVKRNYTLDFLKFVFAVIVMLFHSNSLTNDRGQMIFLNGRIGVEFFFLVSGCLMCESALRYVTDRQTDRHRTGDLEFHPQKGSALDAEFYYCLPDCLFRISYERRDYRAAHSC